MWSSVARLYSKVGARGRAQIEAEEQRQKLDLTDLIRAERDEAAAPDAALPDDPIPQGERPHRRAQWDEKQNCWTEWDEDEHRWIPTA